MKYRSLLSWMFLIVGCGGDSGGGEVAPQDTLVRADMEPAGANCPAGGVALRSGVDTNSNGVLDDNEITSTTYVCASTPATTVGNVSGFEAIGVGDHAVLRWTNPTGAAFAGVMIRRATGGYPASPTDGTAVYDGFAATVTDSGLAIGTAYFYRAFAHDTAGTYASGVDATVLALPPGHRDPTFNSGGFVLIPPTLVYSGLTGLAVDGDGRPAVCAFEQGATSGTNRGVLWQLDRAGMLDPQFNGGAELTLKAPPSTSQGILFDSAGRVLVTDTGPRVSRFLPDGTRDPSFGTLGTTDLALGAGPAELAFDAQGRILVWGAVGSSMQLTRLTAAGTVDTTFGTSGSVRIDQLPGASSPNVAGTGVAADGNEVIVSGYGTGPNGNFDMAVWRFDSNGAPVTAFGSNGVVTVDAIAGGNVAQSAGIAIDAMGRILVTGSANESGNTQMVLWRFTSAGALDSTFGTAGVVVDRDAAGGTGTDTGWDLVVDATGRIVVVGNSRNAAGGADAVTWRFMPDGTLDASFGAGGRIIERGLDGVGPNFEGAAGVALDPWGRIVVGATVGPSAANEVAIWRYIP